ncbi:hypothetical protein GPECTOR_50g606 [Gonium pectorale]|uniref:Peptidase S49 domain-containing protein n=1 Tax=Gonium pectorale TaxID=33097 RepID=A0A150G7I9_GONPE|nr:hypothetical protein GPECTOR_50g606 [Gonium pectorale]|eukprot:KXZ45812.1 hypothetical protein GPECTOR_50g606 [Gonium pectorale]
MSSWSTALEAVRKNLGRGLAFVGAASVLGSAAVAAARFQAARAERQLPSEFLLELPLDRLHVVDALTGGPLALLRGDVSLYQAVSALRRAAADERCRGVLAVAVSALRRAAADERCRGVLAVVGPRENLGGLATVQELRSALRSFRTLTAAAGRAAPTVAFSASFGEAGGSGMAAYLLASGCERVFVQPSGMLGLAGLESRAFFARGLLERLRAEPYVFAREEYKAAANLLRERGMTGPQRDNLTSLLGDMAEQMLSAMAAGRGLTGGDLREAMEAGPLMPRQALQRRLLDGTKYRDEAQALFPISSKALEEEKTKQGRKHRRRKDDFRMARVTLDKYIELTELAEAARAAGRGGAGWLTGTALEGLVLAIRGKLQDTLDAEKSSVGPPEARAATAGKPKVALVTAVGTIVQGPVAPSPASNQQVIDAAKLSAQLAQLLEDPDGGWGEGPHRGRVTAGV